jgi:hypothetical protein
VQASKAKVRPKDVSVAVALAIFALTLIRDVRVPLLGWVDLGFHELGHLLTYVFPDLVTAAAGSIFQVLVPVGLAGYFLLIQNDRAGSALCLGWAATSTADAARYVADAPYERLELIGGEHDWAFVFDSLGHMEWADEVALVIRIASWLMLLGAASLLALPYLASPRR